MDSIRDLLARYSLEVEMRMRLQLESVVKGSLIRTQLPQVWNFKTEIEKTHFRIEKSGKAIADPGLAPDPDVTVEWNHEFLCSVLKNRSLESIPPGEEPMVTINTVRGRIGYAMLRRFMGF